MTSGSADETIKAYDLETKREDGTLIQHEGSISCLDFFKEHMLSADRKGVICVWKIKDWEYMLTLKAHKGGVNDLAIHPSGKCALSVGDDKLMKMWNLVTGKCAHTRSLGFAGEVVAWSPDGTKYALLHRNGVAVHSADGALLMEASSTKRLVTLCFIDNDHLAFAGEIESEDDEEEKIIEFWSISENKQLFIVDGHFSRIKKIVSMHADDMHLMISACSDGMIRAWKFPMTDGPGLSQPECIADVDIEARITDIAVRIMKTASADPEEKAKPKDQAQKNAPKGKKNVPKKQTAQNTSKTAKKPAPKNRQAKKPALKNQAKKPAPNNQAKKPAPKNRQAKKPAPNNQAKKPAPKNRQAKKPALKNQAKKPAPNNQAKKPALKNQAKRTAPTNQANKSAPKQAFQKNQSNRKRSRKRRKISKS
eukprot:TRINITY_DN2264_c0_g1_i1.p1 TRINITY_DN2264_c0_g1~~TRINITY_DN2264_c0_g1_i1.p1  ORF type:complete len:480 (-),score=90.81 TRINITY_DN2264_c0_g1_i1:47-1312(-)